MGNQEPEHRWLGWAIERPGHPLFLQFGGDEEGAWDGALSWPSAEEIAAAKAAGARAFPIEIYEAATTSTERFKVTAGMGKSASGTAPQHPV